MGIQETSVSSTAIARGVCLSVRYTLSDMPLHGRLRNPRNSRSAPGAGKSNAVCFPEGLCVFDCLDGPDHDLAVVHSRKSQGLLFWLTGHW
jgi:hypothetical protein